MKRKYYTLDVFTDRPLAGNPLAVVLDSDDLDDASMQAIAVEFNLSETVFVSPPKDPKNRASIRIYTPAHELPFAGHPTVGTAILLNHLNHLGEGDELVLEEQVGPVQCVISDESDRKSARFDLPKVSYRREWSVDPELLAQVLGLEISDLGNDGQSACVWDGGVPYTLIAVNSINAVGRVAIDTTKLARVEPTFDGIPSNLYVYCEGGEAADADFHARMFAPIFGIWEDPATGSAVASFSGLVAANLMSADESRTFKIEQGYEMGRPSQIFLDITKEGGAVVRAGISGFAVIVSEGVLHI